MIRRSPHLGIAWAANPSCQKVRCETCPVEEHRVNCIHDSCDPSLGNENRVQRVGFGCQGQGHLSCQGRCP